MMKKIIPYFVWFILQFMIFFADVDAADVTSDVEYGSVFDDIQTSEQLMNTSAGDAVAVVDSTYQESVLLALDGINEKICILVIVIILLFGVWISITFMRSIFRK